jgi:hypothetical protein
LDFIFLWAVVFILKTRGANNKNMGTASLLTEILAHLTACTPARGRHQLHVLSNEQEAFSQ